ncbi:MAG: hypothetical protein QM766_11450 [Burkholderiaceae bacterium]
MSDSDSIDRRRQLDSLSSFSLLDALFGRRSRRFGVGMAIPDGPLAYRSSKSPQPLSELERTLLIAAGAGISGWNLGIPYTASGKADSGCHYTVRPIGRTYPSGAATHGSEMLVTDDSGMYLTRFRELDAARIREYQGPDDLPRLVDFLREHIVRISDRRVEIPREAPHLSAHNRWVANRPGSTLFFPIADQVESLLNQLWIRSSEGAPVIEPKSGRLLGNPQPLIDGGVLRVDRAVSLALLENNSRNSTTSELAIASYNIHLLLQAFGLGGWLFSGINPLSLFGAYAEQGIAGFGFRFASRADWAAPNPVGLDGLFEPLIPPYVSDMREAAQRFVDRKFGPRGNHSPQRPGPYVDNAAVKAAIERPSPAFVDYFASLVQDIHDTYGRFPATIPSIGLATYTQAHHIDLDFYDRFYGEGAYLPTHAAHQCVWHPRSA